MCYLIFLSQSDIKIKFGSIEMLNNALDLSRTRFVSLPGGLLSQLTARDRVIDSLVFGCLQEPRNPQPHHRDGVPTNRDVANNTVHHALTFVADLQIKFPKDHEHTTTRWSNLWGSDTFFAGGFGCSIIGSEHWEMFLGGECMQEPDNDERWKDLLKDIVFSEIQEAFCPISNSDKLTRKD